MNDDDNDAVPARASALRGSAWRYRHWLAGALLAVFVYALCGFLVAPLLIEKTAVRAARDLLGSALRLDSVAVNPFVLSLRVDGIELDDPDGDPVARIERMHVNFQASSLFRWAYTFAELRIDSPALYIDRNRSGQLNVQYLFDAPADGDSQPEAEAAGLPRVLIYDFAINDSVLKWDDRMPERPVSTEFGPVNVTVLELNTLPQRSGEQSVVVTTETSGTLSWTGNLQLNPLVSSGRAAVEGPHFALPSQYLRQMTGFEFPRGQSKAGFAYRVHVDDAGQLQGVVEDFDLVVSDVLLRKTNPGEPLADGEVRDVLELPVARIDDASLRWPERIVRVPSIVADDAVVNVYRDAAERINWIPDESAHGAGTGETSSAPGAAPWSLRIDRVEINRLVLGLEDRAVEPHADIGVDSLDLSLTNVSNEEGARMPLEASMVTRGGGTIAVKGDVRVLPSPDVDWQVTGEDLVLANVHPYLQPLADVNLDSGTLSFTTTLKSNDEETLFLAGDARVSDFLVTETDEGSELGSWRRLDIRKYEFSAAENHLTIGEVAFDGAYADIFIARDGTVNLGRIEKGKQVPEDEESGADDTEEAAEQASTRQPEDALRVRIGRVLVTDSGADFADESLPLPFSARIAELEGGISTIASNSREASDIALEGKVDEHGFVRVSGSVTPLDPTLNTDMRVAFENVDMPKFSAYSIPFAGREIANGRLDLDLGYLVDDSKLVGENRIVLHDFELGEKVDHPGAMSLPLGLAVALLKDASGEIDIDLPVRGDLNDPEFRYGGVILKALGNLIVKIVASPFALLGNLIGVEADELSHVDFIAGRADLTPPERERVSKLVEALSLRPQLVLELPGTVDGAVDGRALQQAKVDAAVEARLAKSGEGDDADFAERRRAALESLYAALGADEDPEAALATLEAEFTSVPAGEDGEEGVPLFDSVAYAAELERRLVDAQAVTDQELAALANRRAAAVQAAVVEFDPAFAPRVLIGKPREVEGSDEAAVEMEVGLTTDAEPEAPASPDAPASPGAEVDKDGDRAD